MVLVLDYYLKIYKYLQNYGGFLEPQNPWGTILYGTNIARGLDLQKWNEREVHNYENTCLKLERNLIR